MRIHTIKDAKAFLAVVNDCTGDVWLESAEGDKINLRSELSQFLAVTVLNSEYADKFDLYCSQAVDEGKFFKLFVESDIEP